MPEVKIHKNIDLVSGDMELRLSGKVINMLMFPERKKHMSGNNSVERIYFVPSF